MDEVAGDVFMVCEPGIPPWRWTLSSSMRPDLKWRWTSVLVHPDPKGDVQRPASSPRTRGDNVKGSWCAPGKTFDERHVLVSHLKQRNQCFTLTTQKEAATRVTVGVSTGFPLPLAPRPRTAEKHVWAPTWSNGRSPCPGTPFFLWTSKVCGGLILREPETPPYGHDACGDF